MSARPSEVRSSFLLKFHFQICYHEAYVVPNPDGLWSRLHAEVAVLEDDVLVGHRLAVIAALPVVENVLEGMVL